jgi:hypothetical protein
MSKFGKQLLSAIPGKELLHNRGVLYALCVIALVQIVMYGNVKDFNSIITLLMIGFLVSFFSKNMIIVLGVAICATYLLNYVPRQMISEGAENMKEDEDAEKVKDDEGAEKVKENAENIKEGVAPATTTASDLANEQASSAEKATAPSAAEKKKMLYDNLQGDFKDFQKIQSSILKTMQDIDPLLAKAESFIEKFEAYGKLASQAE